MDRCWSCWVGREEMCSSPLQAASWLPTPAAQKGSSRGSARGRSRGSPRGATYCSYGRGACPGKGDCSNASIAFVSENVKNWICSWIAVSFVWVRWKIALNHISASPQFRPKRSKTRPQHKPAETQSCSDLSAAATGDSQSSLLQPCAAPLENQAAECS